MSRYVWTTLLLSLYLSFQTFAHLAQPRCKTTPESPLWPSPAKWEALNRTVDGRLLKPAPQAAVCHPDQTTYDASSCKTTNWTDATTYAEDPLGLVNPNWSNDSCLPMPSLPCSGQGYPIYVINASTADHVAAGVIFATSHNIRLNVKGSGHDYLGRSSASNSLSIWTKHMRGIDFRNLFRPQNCDSCSVEPAVTLAAGENRGDIYAAAHEHHLTLVGGTGDTIGLGGYLTGGGHSSLSAKLGLAVDQVLEMEVVLASGEIMVANEHQNIDLFWAMRGGGGATFGIMTSVTLKTFRDMPVATMAVVFGGAPDSEAFWNATVHVISQSPQLQEAGVVGYSFISPGYEFQGSYVGGYAGPLVLPNGTIAELEGATASIRQYVGSVPGIQASFTSKQYENLYDRYQVDKNTMPIGGNNAVGSRLLDAKALSDKTRLREAIKVATPPGTAATLNFIAGPSPWNAQPAGGSISVTPAWRRTYVEFVASVTWPFLNETAETIQTDLLTNVYMEALRQLAPDTGSYLNEGDVNEPEFPEAFWGDNYSRLLSIKRKFDPSNVFWCVVCVGSESWHMEGNQLCRV